MNKKTLEEVWYFLDSYVKEYLKEPCDYCAYYECKNNVDNDILKKKYAEYNIIDHKHCLKEQKAELDKLNILRRNKVFNEWSHKPCDICKKKFFRDELILHSEIETEESAKKRNKTSYEMNFVHCCKKCNRSYVHTKKPFYGERFEKR